MGSSRPAEPPLPMRSDDAATLTMDTLSRMRPPSRATALNITSGTPFLTYRAKVDDRLNHYATHKRTYFLRRFADCVNMMVLYMDSSHGMVSSAKSIVKIRGLSTISRLENKTLLLSVKHEG